MYDFIYQCTTCGKTFKRDEVRYLCPDCGKDYAPGMPLKGVLEVILDYQRIKDTFSLMHPDWEMFSAVESEFYPAFAVGGTPFFKSKRLGDEFGFSNLWLKNDGLNPSGSLKDRASFFVVAEANRLHENKVVTASTGNAASALAAVCAAAGKEAVIFCPAKAPKAKLVQMILYGARVIPVDGTYDDAFALSLEYTKIKPGLNRNTGYHPLTIEGKKTAGLEIFVQNGMKAPDAILIATGDGVILSGTYKAFYDLKEAGLIEKMPRLISIQADTSNSISNYWKTGIYNDADHPTTIADSISVKTPSCAHLAKRALDNSDGFAVEVTDNEIMEAQALLASKTGIFAEPAASATVAGMKKIADHNMLDKDAQIVLLISGNGLKDIEAPLKSITIPQPYPLDINGID
ncbi:MAG TPA: threonine synthase [Candidatus Cloacimonadota bacterium]|nr:threonine synthase [Candidatus Cloacimonadota bacterium]